MPSTNILCSVLGHNLEKTKDITAHIKEFKCKRCQKEFTTNSNGQIIEHSKKYKEINRILSKIYKRKEYRLKKKRLVLSKS